MQPATEAPLDCCVVRTTDASKAVKAYTVSSLGVYPGNYAALQWFAAGLSTLWLLKTFYITSTAAGVRLIPSPCWIKVDDDDDALSLILANQTHFNYVHDSL